MANKTLDLENFKLDIIAKPESTERVFRDVELIYVLDGGLNVSVEGKVSSLARDDILVVNANKRRSYRGTDELLFLRMLINYRMLRETYRTGEIIFWCDSSVSDSESFIELRKLLKLILREVLNRHDREDMREGSFKRLALCCGILDILSVNFLIKATDSVHALSDEEGDPDSRFSERLQQIGDYIYANYDADISMKELSEKLYLSNGYLSRFFKKNYGCTFAEYLTDVRLFHAVDDLLYSDKPMTRIAYDNGFSSAALFNKAFKKKYAELPSEFRKHSRKEETEEAQAEKEEEVTRKLEALVRTGTLEEDSSVNIRELVHEVSVSAAESEALKHNWDKLINLGSASEVLNSVTQEHMVILNRALHFKYARVWHPFSRSLLIDLDGRESVQNFTRIDAVLDGIIEQGMIPFIDLGPKPKLLHFGLGSSKNVDRSDTASRYMPEQWSKYVNALMRHLISRYDQEELSKWCIEVWFNEDWRKDEKKTEQYLDIYEITAKIVRSFNDQIRVGGYGIRMDTGAERRKVFYKKLNESEQRPDFLTIGYFAYERGVDEEDSLAKRTTDESALAHWYKKEKKLIEESGLGDLPLIINEWGLSPSVRNAINDSAFMGAYIIRNTLEMYGEPAAMGHLMGSDRPSTYFDTSELLFGGNGLITKDGIFKPAAFAFDFLNRLFPNCLMHDDTCIVTADGHDSYSIVAHNQQKLGAQYYLTPEEEISHEHIWKYFDTRNRMKLRVSISAVTQGTYQVKAYRVSWKNGSVLETWKEMGYAAELSRNDIKYFRRVCEPHLTMQQVDAKDGVLMIEQEMEPNEIICIRIHRKR